MTKFVSSGVQPEEVDLIFPVLDEDQDIKIQLEQFHSIMHVFD
jgi:Ca2+-binding EF-hand superfamily protein